MRWLLWPLPVTALLLAGCDAHEAPDDPAATAPTGIPIAAANATGIQIEGAPLPSGVRVSPKHGPSAAHPTVPHPAPEPVERAEPADGGAPTASPTPKGMAL